MWGIGMNCVAFFVPSVLSPPHFLCPCLSSCTQDDYTGFQFPLLAWDGWMSNCSYFHQHIGNISSLEGRLLCIKRPWITYILESAKHIVRGVQHMALNLSVSSGTVNAKKVNWGEPWAAFSRVQVVRNLSILSTKYVTELRWALSSPQKSTGGRISE